MILTDGWHVAHGTGAIDRATTACRGLVPSGATVPMGEPLWASCYWQAFRDSLGTPEAHLLVKDGRPVVFAALGRQRAVVPSVSNRPNDHVPAFALATYGHPDAAVREALAHLLESAAVLRFDPVYQDGEFVHALTVATRTIGASVTIRGRYPEMAAHLRGPWAESRAQLSSSAVSVAGRRMRQLDRMGRVELACVCDHPALQDVLTECFALEGRGWKGRQGAPIAADPSTLQFYTTLAHAYAAAGRLALHTLRLDGRLIAFQYCLRTGSRLDLLKMSYDEDLARVSPGNVIRLLAYQYELATYGVLNFHMGRVREWKRIWGTTAHERCSFGAYGGNASGRLAYVSGPFLRRSVRAMLRRTGLWRPREVSHAG